MWKRVCVRVWCMYSQCMNVVGILILFSLSYFPDFALIDWLVLR